MSSSASPSVADPVALLTALIRCPSVTPAEGGALAFLESVLAPAGFRVARPVFAEAGTPDVENLFATIGSGAPHLVFAGHTDVVPPGDAARWRHDPFSGAVDDGFVFGRGAVDMKSAIAAWIAAVSQVLAKGQPAGSLSFLITGDEEGVATDGTVRVVEALAAEGEVIDHCIVGEPSSSALLGDMVKIGRRGSINAWFTVEGRQGHVAYPHRAANPITPLVRLLGRLTERVLDEGYEGFQPSNLEVTTVDVGNPATNLIPARATARVNIRFNPAHTGADLAAWFEAEARLAKVGFAGEVTVDSQISGEAFLTREGPFTALVAETVKAVTGREPDLSTTGGTSDARFIRALCPVVELGLVGATMHAVDERVSTAEVRELSRLYAVLIARYFETSLS